MGRSRSYVRPATSTGEKDRNSVALGLEKLAVGEVADE